MGTGRERDLARVGANPTYTGPNQEFRVDPHPAWDYSFSRIIFNGWAEGSRRVYVADLSSVVPSLKDSP